MRKPSSAEVPEAVKSPLHRISGFRIWPKVPYEPPKLYGYDEDGTGDPVAIAEMGWIETPNTSLS